MFNGFPILFVVLTLLWMEKGGEERDVGGDMGGQGLGDKFSFNSKEFFKFLHSNLVLIFKTTL